VVLPGDGDDLQEIVVGWIVMVGAAVAAATTRWTAIARTERMIRASPSFAMLAALWSNGRVRYQVECSLYALDAAAGAEPLCTFPVLTSGGLPADGPAFPVEVRPARPGWAARRSNG
jgi:hypothetical protein